MAETITVAELQHDARRVLERIEREGEPLLVTQRGRGRAILVGLDAHERQQQEIERLRVLALVEAGRCAVAKGRTRWMAEVRQSFEQRWKKPRRAQR
ncbi:type II toxin-antitoxin system Phd/YefM family antitoxin [Acidobacteriia bacterium AH_259_A11_L15]|nr:type II toxin-antitoxin system Phd/YefM family antitoxin [Acidobacteriia bacterium AH_259_A11_L15]